MTNPYITGGAAILGAAVGGLSTGFVTSKIERGRQEFAERRDADREHGIARAAARLLEDDFDRLQSTLTRAESRHQWWRLSEVLERQVSADDRKLLAGLMSADAFVKVASAQGWVDYLVSRRQDFAGDQPAMDDHDRTTVVMVYEKLEEAREALSPDITDIVFKTHNRQGVIDTERAARPTPL